MSWLVGHVCGKQCCQFCGFPAQLGGFSDSLGGQFLAVAGCGFLASFGTCRRYWATAVLSGNQWSVDTADELIIAYGSKPVARAAWQETIGCIIHNTKDKSNIRYAKHIVKLQITRGT